MQLSRSKGQHLREMMHWFPDRAACTAWGGPRFRFPFTEETFIEDACWRTLPSYSLLGTAGQLLGFGQYYLREGRCHLGRLAVAPTRRNRGLGRVLIARLAGIGLQDLGISECSLFVFAHNAAALRCYRNAGFEAADYPGDMPDLDDCLYMVAAKARLIEGIGIGAPEPLPSSESSGERSCVRASKR